MFCAGRVAEDDLKRTMKACGGSIQTSVNDLNEKVLGTCASFQEEQIGGDRYVLTTSLFLIEQLSFRFACRGVLHYLQYGTSIGVNCGVDWLQT